MPSIKLNDSETNVKEEMEPGVDNAIVLASRHLETHAERQNNSTRKTTFINGIGLWHSWTRNFKSPLLAVLDLLDNAFDAGFSTVQPNFKSKIHIFGDEWISPQTNFTESSENPFGDCVTGMVIANNSAEPICDITSILEVYKSAKSDCESIGENGVGLKQGCATISDLSFVLIRSDERIAIGVIAKGLQHEAGAYLPSYPLDICKDIKEQLEKIFKVDDPEVGECTAAYGFGDLNVAIERLEKHIEAMLNSPEWGDENYVFRLIMDKVRYSNDKFLSRDNDGVDGNSYRLAVHGLMKELHTVLPQQYIHIPEHFDVRVGTEKVYFNYWQCRLAELSVFYVKIDPDKSFQLARDWKEPSLGYHVRVFLGFDPIRFVESEDPSSREIKTMSLFLYSRQSGRLIRHEPDARSMLGVTTGGTSFCQGFTVIVDDFSGQLPLNPTKQDVAFSEQKNGQVHEKNLYSWVYAIASGYYSYVLNFFNGRKGDLSQGVKGLAKPMKALFEKRCDEHFQIPSLANANYTSYTKSQLPFRRLHEKIVGMRNIMTEARSEGPDTKFRLFSEAAMVDKEGEIKESKRKAKTPGMASEKRVRLKQNPINTELSNTVSTKLEPCSSIGNSRYPARRRQSAPQPDTTASCASPPTRVRTNPVTRRPAQASKEPHDISDGKPPALVTSWELEAERWKAEAERQAQDAQTWKARARMLKKEFTEKKAYYEHLLMRKEEELLFHKNETSKANPLVLPSSASEGEDEDENNHVVKAEPPM